MEIERKFTIKEVPDNLEDYKKEIIEQAYLCTDPVIRVRRSDDTYYMTYKNGEVLAHDEYNLPLSEKAYAHLLEKADGNIIRKTRYHIPYGKYDIELDIFEAPFAPMRCAEVEFPTEEEADAFTPPDWFSADVTYDRCYSNSYLSRIIFMH